MIYNSHYFLSLGEDGAYVLDITNHQSVVVKHKFDRVFFNEPQIFISTLTYEGNLLLMVEKLTNKIYVIDSFNVTEPKIISTISLGEDAIQNIEIMGHSLIVITKNRNMNKYAFHEYLEDL